MLMNIKLVHIVPMKDQIEEIEEFGIPSIILSTKDDMPQRMTCHMSDTWRGEIQACFWCSGVLY